MTGGDWLDDTGLVRLPSDALVRGRRLGDPASTADFGWSWPPPPGRTGTALAVLGRWLRRVR
jgi:hypothetical protein